MLWKVISELRLIVLTVLITSSLTVVYNLTLAVTPSQESPIAVWSDYTLDRNITFSGDGFIVKANDVTLDLHGYTITGNGDGKGVNLTGVTGVTVKNGEITNFSAGIYLRNARENAIIGNTVFDNDNGIWLDGSGDNTISENMARNNNDGLLLWSSGDNILRDNNMTDNLYNFRIWSPNLRDFISDIDTSNIVNGKPVYYWVNEQNRQVPATAGYIGLVDSTDIVVKDVTLRENGPGVLCVNTKNIVIENVTATRNWYGIYLRDSTNITITGNALTDNGGVGVYLFDSDYSNIAENTLRNNKHGIHVITTNYSTIVNNIVNHNTEYGVYLYSSSFNTIQGNVLVSNSYGLRIEGGSGNNVIYHNDFIENTNQAFVDPEYSSINRWDSGYPAGGNYWNQYIVMDVYSGPTQDQPLSDGIGDNPYTIDANNVDRYPIFRPIPVEITNVSISKIVTNDTITYLAAAVVNIGDQRAEYVKISALYDEYIIKTKTIRDLAPEDYKIVIFKWNTTNVPLGKYNITFLIPPDYRSAAGKLSEVPQGEVATDGIINIQDLFIVAKAFDSSTLREDVNCDGKIDEIDINIATCAFGTQPEDERWDPEADVNEDGKVDILDTIAITKVKGSVAHPRWNQLADFNDDRQVNIVDIFTVAKPFQLHYLWKE